MNEAIYLVRHGQTQANKDNRFAGRTQEPLHPEGIEEISRVAENLKSMNLDLIMAGPSLRTIQSAEIIAEKCGLAYQVDVGLHDIDLPHWDGLTKDEIRQKWGAEYPTWLENPESFKPNQGETLFEVRDRVVRTLEKVKDSGRRVLLVTHLIVARCLLLHQQNRALNDFRSLKVGNSEIVKIC